VKPHDELFREMISDPETRRDLVRICVPDLAGRIDFDTVTTIDATFTGGKQADLLVSMRDRGGKEHLVYMLVEHKSYHDPLVAVQLHRYLGEIWQQLWINRSDDERGPLPRIHPVVFYHGRSPWTVPLELTGLHDAGDTEHDHDTGPLMVELAYRLVDLWAIEPFALNVRVRTLAYLITLRYVFRSLDRVAVRRLVETLGMLPIDVKTRIRLFEYLLFNMPDENTGLLVTELEEREYTMEGGEAIMTVAQELRRQGREEGRDKERIEVARRMLDKGIPLDLIVETTGLTKEQVIALKNGEENQPSSLD
jgi:predicted transposase YdaD